MILIRQALSCPDVLKRQNESTVENIDKLKAALIFKPQSILLFVEQSTGTRANLYIYTRIRRLLCYSVLSTSKEHYRVKSSRGVLKRGPSIISFWLKERFTRERMSDQFRIDVWFQDRPEARLQQIFKIALQSDPREAHSMSTHRSISRILADQSLNGMLSFSRKLSALIPEAQKPPNRVTKYAAYISYVKRKIAQHHQTIADMEATNRGFSGVKLTWFIERLAYFIIAVLVGLMLGCFCKLVVLCYRSPDPP